MELFEWKIHWFEYILDRDLHVNSLINFVDGSAAQAQSVECDIFSEVQRQVRLSKLRTELKSTLMLLHNQIWITKMDFCFYYLEDTANTTIPHQHCPSTFIEFAIFIKRRHFTPDIIATYDECLLFLCSTEGNAIQCSAVFVSYHRH